MYIARFSYDVLPKHRKQALDFIQREAEAARKRGLTCKVLIPVTRAHDGAALHFEVELTGLDQLDQFRQRGLDTSEETGNWMHAFSEILLAPPMVEIMRVETTG
jgi:hypothetical protein